MKQAELTQAVLNGAILCVGSFLSGRADTIQVRDKQTGGRREMVVARCIILTDTEPVTINEWLPDGSKADTWKVPFKKADKIVVHVTAMEQQNGLPVLRGRMETLVP